MPSELAKAVGEMEDGVRLAGEKLAKEEKLSADIIALTKGWNKFMKTYFTLEKQWGEYQDLLKPLSTRELQFAPAVIQKRLGGRKHIPFDLMISRFVYFIKKEIYPEDLISEVPKENFLVTSKPDKEE